MFASYQPFRLQQNENLRQLKTATSYVTALSSLSDSASLLHNIW